MTQREELFKIKPITVEQMRNTSFFAEVGPFEIRGGVVGSGEYARLHLLDLTDRTLARATTTDMTLAGVQSAAEGLLKKWMLDNFLEVV